MNFLSAPRITFASMSALNPQAKSFVPDPLSPAHKTAQKNNSRSASNELKKSTDRRHVGFLDLPKELRDQIYSLAFGDEDTTKPMPEVPCEAYRKLSQVSRVVRADSADFYWSSCRPYLCFDVYRERYIDFDYASRTWPWRYFEGVLDRRYDLDESHAFKTWFDTYGKLAVHRIRWLNIHLISEYASIQLNLSQPSAQLSSCVFVRKSCGPEVFRKVEEFALAVLSLDGQAKVTPERFVTLYNTLAAIPLEARLVTQMGRGISSDPEIMREQKRAVIMDLLRLER